MPIRKTLSFNQLGLGSVNRITLWLLTWVPVKKGDAWWSQGFLPTIKIKFFEILVAMSGAFNYIPRSVSLIGFGGIIVTSNADN